MIRRCNFNCFLKRREVDFLKFKIFQMVLVMEKAKIIYPFTTFRLRLDLKNLSIVGCVYNFYEMFYKTDIYSLPRDISMISDFLNNSARGFFPFSRFVEKRKGFEFISLLFVIWFAILTWQIIVAVKRNTQH